MSKAVASVRRRAGERGKSLLAWWVGPGRYDLEERLEAAGLVHEDTPGFEAVENAMVLLESPQVRAATAVDVKQTETYEEFFAATQVTVDAFDFPEAMRAETIAEAPKRWTEYTTPSNPGRQFIASIDGRVVARRTPFSGRPV
jgi:hypothetical protein